MIVWNNACAFQCWRYVNFLSLRAHTNGSDSHNDEQVEDFTCWTHRNFTNWCVVLDHVEHWWLGLADLLWLTDWSKLLEWNFILMLTKRVVLVTSGINESQQFLKRVVSGSMNGLLRRLLRWNGFLWFLVAWLSLQSSAGFTGHRETSSFWWSSSWFLACLAVSKNISIKIGEFDETISSWHLQRLDVGKLVHEWLHPNGTCWCLCFWLVVLTSWNGALDGGAEYIPLLYTINKTCFHTGKWNDSWPSSVWSLDNGTATVFPSEACCWVLTLGLDLRNRVAWRRRLNGSWWNLFASCWRSLVDLSVVHAKRCMVLAVDMWFLRWYVVLALVCGCVMPMAC